MYNMIYEQDNGKFHHQDMLRDADHDRLARKVRVNRSFFARFGSSTPQRTPVRKLTQFVTALLR